MLVAWRSVVIRLLDALAVQNNMSISIHRNISFQ